MKRIISTIMTISAFALLLASCGKEFMPWNRNSKAIKVTVAGVSGTKASIYTTSNLSSFRIRGYVTDKWREDQVGQSTPEYSAGLYSDPQGGNLKDIAVTKGSDWRITGNEDYDNPKFSWVNGKAMLFFAYAPATKGTLTLTKSDSSTDATFPFGYSATVNAAEEITSTNCDDLIFAYASNTATYESDNTSAHFGELKSGSSDVIDLKFYHALAQIRFCVDPADFTSGADIKLIKVRLLGPKSTTAGSTRYIGIASSGKCTFTGPSTFSDWTDIQNRFAYSQTFNGTSGVSFASGLPTGWTSKQYGTSPDVQTIYTCEGDVILVIPQNLSDCGVEVTIQEGSSDPVLLQGKLPATTSSSTTVSWDAGYYYTYKIGTTGTQEDLSLTMTLVDWAERESYIPID
ncbi:MAG: fimbrillin family protein [Bacteroidales bacterium]|nr:fimbrillin family protein [Bacteroidales bacterium]